MSRLSCLFILWIVCGSAFSRDDEQDDDYVKSYGYGSIYGEQDSGKASLAPNPMAAAILNVDKSPQLFHTVVSRSIDSLERQLVKKNAFDPINLGFNPVASDSFVTYDKSAKLISQPAQKQQQQQSNFNNAPNTQQARPLRYDIRTIHDPSYKVYKADENEGAILSALKKNPTVAAYFQPNTNIEVNHPLKYRKEDLIKKFEGNRNYKQNPSITGPARFRRYTGGRTRENSKKAEEEQEEDPYHYKAEYISKPKAFDESPYSSPYKKKKDGKDEYVYPYSYDSGYDHKEYERIKELSEKQAAEIKQNPGNCQEVKRDGMSCMTCKDPKTGGNYESCSYVAEPKNNKYAYSKERKYDSNDDPDEPEQKADSPKKSEKSHNSKKDDSAPQKYTQAENEKPYSSYKNADNADDASDKYKAYYIHTTKPKPSEALRAASSEDSSEEANPKKYDYQKALPGFYTNNEQKKDVEHVLAEFKKKDRSACKKVKKNAMTCFQCLDQNGLKHEECMFVSESAPKQSHLAYQELKEFTSKPATLEGGNEGAESQTVTTSSPPEQAAAYATNYDKKLKRKKAPQLAITAAASNSKAKVSQKVKRSEGSEIENEPQTDDVSNIAPPEEFAGTDSKAAFWAETVPRYSAVLGVSLPEYMLSRSEHEASFDEAVAGA